ncbi:hypothetical protein [Candidatus Hecatella orcuttiae]|nr:hypothetical protein [Candidatus Hecatella orcuttiae]
MVSWVEVDDLAQDVAEKAGDDLASRVKELAVRLAEEGLTAE